MQNAPDLNLSDNAYNDLKYIEFRTQYYEECSDLTTPLEDMLECPLRTRGELIEQGLVQEGDLGQTYFTPMGIKLFRELFPNSTTKYADSPGFRVQRGASHNLSTGGMGPCTGIAIVDSDYKAAVVGHFYFPPLETDVFEEMLSAAKEVIPDLGKAVVQLAGTTRELDEPEAYGPGAMIKARNFVKNQLIEAGIDSDNIREDWNDNNVGQEIKVNLTDKTIEVRSF